MHHLSQAERAVKEGNGVDLLGHKVTVAWGFVRNDGGAKRGGRRSGGGQQRRGRSPSPA